MTNPNSNIAVRMAHETAPFWRYLNPFYMVLRIWENRELLVQFTLWEILERYRGSAFGLFWTVLVPLLRLVVYTVVFSILLGGRKEVWGLATDIEVGMMIFAGLIIFSVFSETFGRSPNLMWSNKNYVKYIVFPIEILPVSITVATIIHSFAGVFILLVIRVVFTGSIYWTVLYLPLLYIPLAFLTVGTACIISTIGVFWRDISNLTQSFIQLLLFLSAIVYPFDCLFRAVPERLEWLMRLNPISTIVEDSRRVLMQGLQPDWFWFSWTVVGAFIFMVISYAWFMRSKGSFADLV